MGILKLIQYGLAAAIVFLVAAAGGISLLVVERQDALEESSRYNVAWSANQAVIELTRLENRIAAFGLRGGGVGQEEIELRFDIFANRLRLMQAGEFTAFVEADADRRAVVADVAAAVAAADLLIPQLSESDTAARLLTILLPLDAKLVGLAADANHYTGSRAAADQHELMRLHRLNSGVTAGLILCGLVLVGFLVKQNEVSRRQETALRTQNLRFDTALNNMARGLCMFDAGQRLIVSNGLFRSMFGFSPQVVKPGVRLEAILGDRGSGDGTAEDVRRLFGLLAALIEARKAASFEHELDDGRILAVHHQPMGDGGWVATYADITERRRAEARIAHMARHDPLTHLPNRLMFRERVEQALAAAPRHGEQPALVCLDLDQFKTVNDTLGYPVGDMLLRAAAQRLAGCIRETDMLARLGGDEFAIVQMAPSQPHHAALLAQRIVDVLAAPYEIDGHEINIGASVGVAVAPGDGQDPDTLLRNAHLALDRAKADGRATFRFFEPQMDAQVQARSKLEHDLRQALVNGEFELHYQPLVDLASGAATGFEALLRWNHPQRGLVAPGDFIPAAEETGLIQPIGEWVLRRACAEAAAWPPGFTVAVNLSPVQFKNRKLTEIILSALAASRLPAQRLELEITESVVLEDSEATRATLHRLHQLGVRIALDDFGTGYSSLSCLRMFPFDKVKIDRSFVREMTAREDCAAIVRAVVALASNLGMTTTAEGVETPEQRERLRAEGCGQAQGFLFSRALPAGELAPWLAAKRHTDSHAA